MRKTHHVPSYSAPSFSALSQHPSREPESISGRDCKMLISWRTRSPAAHQGLAHLHYQLRPLSFLHICEPGVPRDRRSWESEELKEASLDHIRTSPRTLAGPWLVEGHKSLCFVNIVSQLPIFSLSHSLSLFLCAFDDDSFKTGIPFENHCLAQRC